MILILNCGSQSIKYKIYSKSLKLKREKKIEIFGKKNFAKVLRKELLKIDEEITLVGHRVVHGGEKFKKPTVITGSVLRKLKKIKLAPLHNPYNLLGIKIASRRFPRAKRIAVFDTGFYSDLPEKASLYPVPGDFKRYGFHGISHEYVSSKYPNKKVISCHLGGGASITAINKGKAVDTSMGYTPIEGIMMMTRSGDIDPGIVLELGKKAEKILNHDSGVKAICGYSDMREVLKEEKKDKDCRLALELYTYKIQKYIGAYYAILRGCDVLIFTGAIGYGSEKIRKMITKDLKILKTSKTKIVPIKSDEALFIAQKITEKVRTSRRSLRRKRSDLEG